MKELVRAKALELGFDACGFASAAPPASAPQLEKWLAEGRHGEMQWLERNAFKRVDPQKVLPNANSVVCLAASYSIPPRAQKIGMRAGVVARYAQHADYHDILAEPLKALSGFIDSLQPNTSSLWYIDTGPLLERDLAQRAGIGFVGKHTNLIHRKLGNWFFISEIITTAQFEPDISEHNRCGSCARCIDACPTNAIEGPFQLDARRCISYLTIELKGAIPIELRPLLGNRIYGCDDCLAVCPWNRFAREGALMKPHRREDLDQPALLELLTLDDQQFRARFARSPILRTKRRGLLRNVCVALGNVGDASALPALERAALDPEPLIAEHARWAVERIKERMAILV